MISTKSTGSDAFCPATLYCSPDQLKAFQGTRGDYLASGLLAVYSGITSLRTD